MRSISSKLQVNHYSLYYPILVEKLCEKLRIYQAEENIQSSLYVADPSEKPALDIHSHVLGPLFLEYDATVQSLDREVSKLRLELKRQAEDTKGLLEENTELTTKLEVQGREYMKLLETMQKTADTFYSEGEEGDSFVELQRRVHFLTEEN